MPGKVGDLGFDPDFDDTKWTDGWLHIPIAQVPPGRHSSGYRIERHMLQYTEVFGHPMQLASPLECRLLFDPADRLWMSDTPQERIMMFNNGRRSQGNVLVGGLGLGLYPQYAVIGGAGSATRFTVVERSSVVIDIVEPTLSASLRVPLEVRTGDLFSHLSGPVSERYDTIFVDTWETLDAAHLPMVNRLRDQALHHLAPGGQVLLWGYRWMLRLFEEACRQLLTVAPGRRTEWFVAQVEESPQAVELLTPVWKRYGEQEIADMESTLEWCRKHITRYTAPM